MKIWKWYTIDPKKTQFFLFYMKIVRKYGHMDGSIAIKWYINNKTYKFIFEQIEENCSSIELYERIDIDD